jgi:hypothetical protein
MSLPRDLLRLRQRFKLIEAERGNRQTEKSYIALEALAAFCGGRLTGYSDEDLRKSWLPEWGELEITVPFVLLKELADAWADYLEAPSGKSFGEVLGIEGGGQGKSRTRERRKSADAEYWRTNDVWIEYLIAGHTGSPISKEKAKQIVAEKHGISFETVNKAFKRHGKFVEQQLIEAGVILVG